jgi:hypothetical protein
MVTQPTITPLTVDPITNDNGRPPSPTGGRSEARPPISKPSSLYSVLSAPP